MRLLKGWLLWKSEQRHGETKARKVPYYIDGRRRSGTQGSDADVAALATYDQAVAAFQAGGYTGVGFATLPVWRVVALDFDAVITDGVIDQEVAALIATTYSEVSPSGTGVRAFFRGEIVDRKSLTPAADSFKVEFFHAKGFVTITGNVTDICEMFSLEDTVAELTPEVLALYRQRFLIKDDGKTPFDGDRPTASAGEAFESEWVAPQTITELRSALLFLRADDRELWVRMGHALKTLGEVGRGLFLDWSATSALFSPPADAETWESFKPTRTGYQAVFAEAQRKGWLNPSSNLARGQDSAGSQPPPGQDKHPGFAFVQARELLAQPKPIAWLITGMFEKGSLATLFGASGSGKSFGTIDWSCCIATGRPWNGKETAQGAVFYIAGEGHAGIGRRLKAWEQHNQTPLEDAPLFFSTCPAALMDAGNAAAVANAVNALADDHGVPSLIVIDTFARNMGNGEENSNADVGLFINNIDVLLRMRFGATVLIVHHSGWTEKERGRGASAMRAAMDSEYRLDYADDIRTLICTKSKESEQPKPMAFTLEPVVLDGWVDDDGVLMTSAVLSPIQTIPKPARKVLTGANRIALEALEHALEADGVPPTEALAGAMGILAPLRVVGEEVWRQRAYAEGISDGEQDAKQKAFARSRKALLDMKKISTWQGDYWLGGFAPDGAKVEEILC